MSYFVYIVRCFDDTLYTGYAVDVLKRVSQHNNARGAKYTSHRLPVTLVYQETFETKSEAMKREYAIKQLKRNEKEALIAFGLK